jgi:hypothetical protein
MRRMSFAGEYVKLSRFFSCFLTQLATSWFFLYLPPRCVDSANRGSGRGEEPSEANVLRLIQIRLAMSIVEKITPACQGNSPQTRIADSSFIKAVSFSSAWTHRRVHVC